MCFLPLKSSHYPSRPVPVPELFGKYPTRPVPKSKTPTCQTLSTRRGDVHFVEGLPAAVRGIATILRNTPSKVEVGHGVEERKGEAGDENVEEPGPPPVDSPLFHLPPQFLHF